MYGFIQSFREVYWTFKEFEKMKNRPNAIFIPKRSAKIKAKRRRKKK